ncbi:hypothetical protein HKX48_003533 [Thoreauomyces humboldtii]|nr:hypothetical protein HKX48_003533 [Thoreauomyces humboldtii]
MGEGGFSHRSGLKQQNKTFKSRHSTKGQVKAKAKGKVEAASSVKNKHLAVSHKADRKNQAKLVQQRKRSDVVASNRLFSGASGAPKIVAIVPLCPDVDARIVVSELHSSVGQELANPDGPTVLYIERFKQKLQLVPLRRNLLEILDGVKVADFVMFVVSAEVEVDAFGDQCLTTIRAQGVPSVVAAVQHLERIPAKKQPDIRKALLKYMEEDQSFPDTRLFHTAMESDALAALRHVTQQRPKPVSWRDRHAYMLAENVAFAANEGDESVGTLAVTGYVRGNNLSANRLVHLPNYGDFQIKVVMSSPTPAQLAAGMEVDATVLDVPNPEVQDTLVAENEVNPMEGEQTWPTEEELQEAEERVQRLGDAPDDAMVVKKAKRVPKGTSAYQAAWIVDEEDEEAEEEEEEEEETGMDVTMTDAPGAVVDWSSIGLGHAPNGNGGDEEHDEEEEEYEDLAEAEGDAESEFDDDYDEHEETKQYKDFLAKQQEERDQLQFPDEVDTPKEPSARVRFQRYRGLKSFRTSPWDPYENLPLDYSRIFQFQNFRRTRRRVLDGLEEGGVCPGTHVTLYIQNVPRAAFDQRDISRPFVAFTLLPHEHKYSILNFTVTRPGETPINESIYDFAPLKSKDPVILHCGFRRYVVQPVYSTNTRGGPNNVHKFERFLHSDQTSIATVYAPIQFGPAPVLVWRYIEGQTSWDAGSSRPLLAHGNVLDLDPCRIVSKRIILTGHPFKVHKRGAVIRYMFWNPEDIDYFKPVQLSTKLGRLGHIRDTLGTHGYMKCIFDGPLKGQDTVCMYLFKRVFPKWTTRMYVEEVATTTTTPTTTGEKDGVVDMVV